MFQFQYGAIKGTGAKHADIARKLFQFQYGAIKGTTTRLAAELGRGRFNSSMVRLKGAQVPPRRRADRTWFQFQYGAIKGRLLQPA